MATPSRSRLLPGVLAELFRPPFGFAAVEVVLQLCDVHGEVALACREGGLELGAGLLALLEPLLADLELGFHLCLAEVEGGVALLQFLGAAGENLLPLVEPLFLALVAATRGEDRLLSLVESRLARGQVFVALPQPSLADLVDLGLARLLGGSPRGGFEPMELGLAGDKLRLALVDAVEPGERFLCDRIAVRDLTLEILHPGREVARLSGELELALVQLPGSSD